ncbi:hypothetical protein [Agromyces bauzanensis]
MTDARHMVARRIALYGGALVVAALVLTSTVATDRMARADDGDAEGNLTVNVSDGIVPTVPPTVRPTVPPTAPPGGPATSAQAPGSFVDTAAAPAPAPAAAPTPEPDEVSLGGVLFVGGLAGGYSPSLNPLAGQLQVWFTVRNVSTSTIDATADFWLEGPFGQRISQVDGVRVDAVVPGEKRTISATLPGVGQWTFLSTHVRFTPPALVDNAELSSFTRDANVFAPPWLIGVLIVMWLGFAAVRYFLRRVELPMRLGAEA